MKAKIFIKLKDSVLDPQGLAVKGGLTNLGFTNVSDVRVGKLIELTLDNMTNETAQTTIDAMCRQLLANTIIENFSYELDPAQ